MKEMSNQDIMQLMNDAHNGFFKKWRDVPLTRDSAEWEHVIKDVNALMKKYEDFTHMDYEIGNGQAIPVQVETRTASQLILWFLDILERRANANTGGNKK